MNENAITLARQHAPCYLYSRDILTAQAEQLRRTFPGFDILFSIKANPFPPVLQALAALGVGADAASAREVSLSAECGMAKEDIYFSAAGKTDRALTAAWDSCHLIADSIGEVQRIAAIAAARGERKSIGLRINPAFNMDGGANGASKFGIDETDLPALGELLCPLSCIPHMKVSVFNVILPGIPDGIFHRLGDHLHSGQMLHPIRHGQADGTGATVQIQQRLATGQLRKFPGNAVQPLRLGSVHLVKGMGGQLHPDAAHGIPDLRLPQQGFRPLTQNHVGACRIHIHADAGQLRKLALQLLTQGDQLFPCRTGHHKAKHDFPGMIPLPQVQMPQ